MFGIAYADRVFLHQCLEIRTLHPGFLGPFGYVPCIALERLEYELPVDLFHRLLTRGFFEPLEFVAGPRHREVIRPAGRIDNIDEVGATDDVVGGRDGCPLYDVFAAGIRKSSQEPK